jgi:hypothetical protein
MAFSALRSTFRRGGDEPTALADGSPVEFAPGTVDATADGGIDAVAFGCPSCGRTLARGASRCDGCGQRLLLDVPLDRAAKLVGAGTAGGILLTLVLVNLFAPARPASTAAADAGAGTGTGGTGTAVTLEIPTAAAAALRGTTAINGRLAAEAAPLAAALDAKRLNTTTVQKVLRRMSIDTRAGAGMVKTFAGWPEAVGQQAALAAFYEDLGAQIDKGLGASLKSTEAYRKAAKAILVTLGEIPSIDASARDLAVKGNLELIPVTFPDELQ